MNLTGKQRRQLRALGHKLNAIVTIGKEGLSDPLIEAVNQALEDHELIKIRIGQNSSVDRNHGAEELAERTSSCVAQVLGGTILLYRAHPDEPKIKLAVLP